MFILYWHKNALRYVMERMNLSWYGLAWISFAEGMFFGFLITYLTL